MTVIKKGFRVTVKTWENDADNYNSGSAEGLSRPEVVFLVDFVKLFSSQNNYSSRGIGNMYDPNKSEREAAEERVKEVVERHRATIEKSEAFGYFLYEGEFNEDGWRDYAYDLTLSGGEFFTRVMDSFKVEFIPQDIVLEDVTKEFE